MKGSTCTLLPAWNPFTFRKKQLSIFFYNIILKLYFKKGPKQNVIIELTTTPNCSGSDKLLYSFLNLDNAFNCSCSGRCFIKFYKEKQNSLKNLRFYVACIIVNKLFTYASLPYTPKTTLPWRQKNVHTNTQIKVTESVKGKWYNIASTWHWFDRHFL